MRLSPLSAEHMCALQINAIVVGQWRGERSHLMRFMSRSERFSIFITCGLICFWLLFSLVIFVLILLAKRMWK